MNTDMLRALWKEAFGDTDAFLDKFFQTGFSPDRCATAYRDGQLAGALYWFDCFWGGRKLAYIYAVATAKAFRNQGVCKKLMEQCHEKLASLGYAGATLVPVDRAVSSLYEKLGYQHFGGMERICIQAEGDPVSLRELTSAEYAAKKEAYLDENAIRQNGRLLDFLSTYVRFYETEGALFCVATEADTAWFQEFFGDVQLAPCVLQTLQVSKGHLGLPNGKTPFAMYRSFTRDTALPSYLGIALD